MMSIGAECRPSRRKVLLGLACFVIGLVPVVSTTSYAGQANAQTAAPNPAQKIDDTWQGTLHIPKSDQHPQIDLRLVVKISKADAGALKAVWYSIDQSGQSIPIATVNFQDGVLKFTIAVVDRSYEGKMSGDGKSIAGKIGRASCRERV